MDAECDAIVAAYLRTIEGFGPLLLLKNFGEKRQRKDETLALGGKGRKLACSKAFGRV